MGLSANINFASSIPYNVTITINKISGINIFIDTKVRRKKHIKKKSK